MTLDEEQATGRLLAPAPYLDGVMQIPLDPGPNEFVFKLPPKGVFVLHGVNILYASDAPGDRVSYVVSVSDSLQSFDKKKPVPLEALTTPGKTTTLDFSLNLNRKLAPNSRVIVTIIHPGGDTVSVTVYGMVGWRFN